MFKQLICLLLLLYCTEVAATEPKVDPNLSTTASNISSGKTPSSSFHDYEREIDVPEPMVFDLVRRLNSEKGEYEFNTLGYQAGKHRFNRYEYSPEFEYAFMDGFAGELELPIKDNTVHSYKAALQYHFGEDRFQLHHGIQFIVENHRDNNVNELSPLYIQSGRYDYHHSYLMMIGNRFHQGRKKEEEQKYGQLHPLINLNYFYNLSLKSNVGLEINLDGAGKSFKDVLLMPQIQIALTHQFKLQAGAGALYDGSSWEPSTAFRLILEAN